MSAKARNDVYLVRHGETEWSLSGQHTGSTDLPLLDEGYEQARQTGKRLKGRDFALVLVSPLQRARETCAAAGFANAAQVTDELVEWDYGEVEGHTTHEYREKYGPDWSIWTGPVPGGESAADVGARMDKLVPTLLDADGDVLLFGHGHSLRILTARWCSLEATDGKRFPLQAATLSILGWEHEWRAVTLWNSR